VQDTTYLPSSVEGAAAATASTISDYTYDSYGNPTFVSVTTENETGESYVKTVNTTYGDDGTSQAQDEKRMGKATKVVTTTSKLAPQDGTNPSTIVHTTTFEYGTVQNLDTALPLVKKKVEPGKGVPIELHTAYDHDVYGNVTVTTSCASDFDSCQPGATNPGDTSDPAHPPFRTTRVSYDPIDFPTGSPGLVQNLSYGAGRYPVSTADSAGHTQTSAYDPLFGVPIQTEAVDGIQTCYKYDALGWKTTEIARCGSTGPLSTTYARYKSVYAGSSMAKTVTVTSPPTNSKTWFYADVLGRTVETLAEVLMVTSSRRSRNMTTWDGLGHRSPFSPPILNIGLQPRTIGWVDLTLSRKILRPLMELPHSRAKRVRAPS
jgi:hypothetical protein